MPRTTRAEPPEPAPEPQSLTALRARVDALDHEMLSVLERRMHRIDELSYSILPIGIVVGAMVGLILLLWGIFAWAFEPSGVEGLH